MQSIIKRRDVRETTNSQEAGSPHQALPAQAAHRRGHEKRVQLLRLDGVVHALELACSCGEVTLIEFEYPHPPESPSTP